MAERPIPKDKRVEDHKKIKKKAKELDKETNIRIDRSKP